MSVLNFFNIVCIEYLTTKLVFADLNNMLMYLRFPKLTKSFSSNYPTGGDWNDIGPYSLSISNEILPSGLVKFIKNS